MSDQGQKTEQPTPRRLKKARDDGQFPVSREFVAAAQFTAFVAMVASFGPQWWEQANLGLRGALGEAFRKLILEGNLDRGALVPLALSMATALLAPFALLGGVLLLISVAAQLGSTQLGFASKRLAPDLTRLDPLRRIKQLPRQNTVQFVQAAVLLPMFLYAVYVVGRANLDVFLRLPSMGLRAGVQVVAGSLEDLLWKAAGLFLAVGFIDLVRQRRRWLAELKMSKQEIREEMKDIDGNPMTKMRIRRIQRDLMRRRMMQDVEKATAVVVNPTHFAVAIRYVPAEMPAPKVVAKGQNFLALRIRERAIRHQVPVVENPPLAQALYKSAEVGQEIPAHLYRAVAEVLAYIYRLMNGRLPGSQ